MASKSKPTEKSEKDLLDDIRRLLILLLVKGKATQQEIGKALGVGNSQIANLMAGVGKNGKEKKIS